MAPLYPYPYSRHKAAFAPIVLIGLCFLVGTSLQASEYVAPRSKLGNAMLSMMDALGMINRDSYDGLSDYGSGQDWPGSWGTRDRNPWNSPPPSPLDGVWLGLAGERLLIRGTRFRLISADRRRLEGLLRIQNNQLALYIPRIQLTQLYAFAYHQGRLVLQDVNGNLLLYQRYSQPGQY